MLLRLVLLTLALGATPGAVKPPAPPKLLSRTGLYAASGQVAAGNLPYAPQYPLWSDGATKSRWIQLPKGTVIEGRNEDAWDFPVGTKFWKEFAFKGRKVETRLIWKTGPRAWVFASYHWNEAQTDAVLVPKAGLPEVAEIEPGLRHSIPSVADCLACHENAGPEPLGFTALQLSPDRDPLAIHREALQPGMVTLADLVKRGLIRGVRTDLETQPPRIDAAHPETRSILGYLAANCGSCHRADAPIPELTLDFRHTQTEEPGLLTSLGKPSLFTLPEQPTAEAKLIHPGLPDASMVVYRMASRQPDTQMPPLGTVKVDAEAVQRIRDWIATLKGPRLPAR